MLRTHVYFEIGDLMVAQAGVGNHAAYRPFDNCFRSALTQRPEIFFFEAVREAGVMPIKLLIFLLPVTFTFSALTITT